MDDEQNELSALEDRQRLLALMLISAAEKNDSIDPMSAAELLLVGFRIAFLKTGSPLHLWRGYREARKHGWPVPEWFFKYLDEATAVLARAVDKPLIGSWATAVAAAFGLDSERARTAYRDRSGLFAPEEAPYAGRSRQKQNYRAVAILVQTGLSVRDAIARAAEETGVPIGTLKRHYYANRPLVLNKQPTF
jgi:hypothetical protein